MDLKRATLWALLVVGGLLSSSEAKAQDQVWLRDERLNSGRGIERDRLRYSGGLAATFGYDSNPFLRADNTAEPRVDTFKLSITPFFGVETRNPPGASRPSYSLSANASVSYYEFIQGPTKSTLATDDLSGHRNFGLNGGLRLKIAPGARWGGDMFGSVVRTIQPSNLGDPTASYNRTNPTVGGGVSWTPGGGLFSWRVLGYSLGYSYFEANAFQRYNNFNHNFSSEASWRFLPRTSFFTSSQLSLIRYSNSTEQSDGDAMTSRAGINGLLTDRFGFLTSVGWATTVFGSKGPSTPQDFDSLVAQIEARFYLSTPAKAGSDSEQVHPTSLILGYMRDWTQSYIGNFYGRDRGYAAFSYFFSAKFHSTLQASVARLSFPATTFADGSQRNGEFSSLAINTNLFVEYMAAPNFGIFVSGDYTGQITDSKLRIDITNAALTDSLSYSRFNAALGLRYLL